MSYSVVTATGERPCSQCGQVKVCAEFPQYAYTTAQGKRSRRYDSRCRDCQRERRRARHVRQREHSLATARAWRQKHPQRARAAITAYRQAHRDVLLRQRVVAEQKRRLRGYNRCVVRVKAVTEEALAMARVGTRYLDAYTGDLIDRPTIDHIVPLCRGGEHAAENVCVTSKAMNSSKHATPLLVWMLRRRWAA